MASSTPCIITCMYTHFYHNILIIIPFLWGGGVRFFYAEAQMFEALADDSGTGEFFLLSSKKCTIQEFSPRTVSMKIMTYFESHWILTL